MSNDERARPFPGHHVECAAGDFRDNECRCALLNERDALRQALRDVLAADEFHKDTFAENPQLTRAERDAFIVCRMRDVARQALRPESDETAQCDECGRRIEVSAAYNCAKCVRRLCGGCFGQTRCLGGEGPCEEPIVAADDEAEQPER